MDQDTRGTQDKPASTEPASAGVARHAIRKAGECEQDIEVALPLWTVRARPWAGAAPRKPFQVSYYRDQLVEFARYCILRDRKSFAEMFDGVRFIESDAYPGTLLVRHLPIEEQAREAVTLLKSSLGLALRRREASAIADMIAALALRAAQRIPR